MKHKALQEPKPHKAFRDKYLAVVMMVAALLISFVASAQLDSAKYSPINGYGFKYKRMAFDSVLMVPRSTSPHVPWRAGAIRYNAPDSTLQLWTGNQWNSILTGIGNGIDTAYVVEDTMLVIETPDQDYILTIPGRTFRFGLEDNSATANRAFNANGFNFNNDSVGNYNVYSKVKTSGADRGVITNFGFNTNNSINLWSYHSNGVSTRSYGFNAYGALTQMFAAGHVPGNSGYVQADTTQIILESDPNRLYVRHDSVTITNFNNATLDFRLRPLPQTIDTSYKTLVSGPNGQVFLRPGDAGSGGGSSGPPSLPYKNIGYGGVGGVLSTGEAAFQYDSISNKLTTDSIRSIKNIPDTVHVGWFEGDNSADNIWLSGTSITVGVGATTHASSYASIVAHQLRLNEINLGASGNVLQHSPSWPNTNTLKDSYTTVITAKGANDRYLLFAWGENDIAADGTFGVDTTWFKRDYVIVINYALTQGWSLGDIRIVTPFYQTSAPLSTQQKYVDVTKRLADSMGIQYIDVFTGGKMIGKALLADNIHPSDRGHAYHANTILNAMNQPLQIKTGESLVNAGTTVLNKAYFFGKDTATLTPYLTGITADGALSRVESNRFLTLDGNDTAQNMGNATVSGNVTANQVVRARGYTSFTTGDGFEMRYVNPHGYLIPIDYSDITTGNIFMPSSKLIIGNTTPTAPFSQLYVDGGARASGLYSTGTNIFYDYNANATTLNLLVNGDSVGHIETFGVAGYKPLTLNPLGSKPVIVNSFSDNGSGAKLQINGRITAIVDSTAGATGGFIYQDAATGLFKKTAGSGSGGITTLNTLTGSTQTFATGTAGTDFAITSSGTTHTFDIPSASASARGLVTTGTQTFAGAKTFSSDLTINSLVYGRGGGNDISNIASGQNALFSNTSGTVLAAYGGNALYGNTTGYGSVGIGYQALTANSTGNVNTGVGFQVGISVTGSGNTLFGSQVGGSWLTSQSNIAAIHNGPTGAWLWGDMSTGQVQINAATTPSLTASAALEVKSTTRGFLTPVMSAAQRLAISSPATGLEVFDTDSLRKMMYNGSAWKAVAWTSELPGSVVNSLNSQTGAVTITAGTAITTSTLSGDITVAFDRKNSEVPHTIATYLTDVNNSGTSETDLYTTTVGANKLINNGHSIHFVGTVFESDITATTQIRVYFAGTEVANTGGITISATGFLRISGEIIRKTSTTASASFSVSGNGLTTTYVNNLDLTGLDFTTTNIFKVTGTAGGASGGSNDITAKPGKLTFQSN
jgi:hypothetical protein